MEGRQHRQTIVNVHSVATQIFSTYVMFTEKLRAICWQLQGIFDESAIPTPLHDLTGILEEILEWSQEQYKIYSEART